MSATINGTTITVGNGSLTDASGNVYSIVSLGGGLTSVQENDSAIPGGDGTDVAGSIVEADYADGGIYLKYPSGHWYLFSNDAGWSNDLVTPPSISVTSTVVTLAVIPAVATPAASEESPNGTVITTDSGSITDADGDVYTIVSLGGGLTSVQENGSAIPGGDGTDVAGSIVTAEYANGGIYLEYPSGHWYGFSNSAGWSNGPVTQPSTSATPPVAAPPVVVPSVTPPSIGPLTLLHAQGTEFVDANGNAVYLAGTHTWNDAQSYANDPQFTFQQFSDFEKSSVDANFIHYWLTAQPSNGDATFPDSQLPFVRSGNGQFDLTQYNQDFFDQLKSNVDTAAANGQYFDVQLLSGIGVYGSGDPFTAANNLQGVGNGSPDDPALLQYEQAYVAKILDTIGTVPNVMYEIANEADYSTLQWQETMVSFVHSYEQQHGLLPQMAGITAVFPLSADASDINAALEGSNADWIAPSGATYRDNPPTPASMGDKPVIVDDDHTLIVTNPGWAWELLTTGNSMAYMDDMAGSGLADPVYATGIDSAGGSYTGGDATTRDATRLAMQETREVASQLDLNGMTPQGSLSTTGYALADAAKGEFVVYAPTGGDIGVDLSGASGTLNAEWVNVATGSFTSAGQVQGGVYQAFTAPDASDALVLHP